MQGYFILTREPFHNAFLNFWQLQIQKRVLRCCIMWQLSLKSQFSTKSWIPGVTVLRNTTCNCHRGVTCRQLWEVERTTSHIRLDMCWELPESSIFLSWTHSFAFSVHQTKESWNTRISSNKRKYGTKSNFFSFYLYRHCVLQTSTRWGYILLLSCRYISDINARNCILCIVFSSLRDSYWACVTCKLHFFPPTRAVFP